MLWDHDTRGRLAGARRAAARHVKPAGHDGDTTQNAVTHSVPAPITHLGIRAAITEELSRARAGRRVRRPGTGHRCHRDRAAGGPRIRAQDFFFSFLGHFLSRAKLENCFPDEPRRRFFCQFAFPDAVGDDSGGVAGNRSISPFVLCRPVSPFPSFCPTPAAGQQECQLFAAAFRFLTSPAVFLKGPGQLMQLSILLRPPSQIMLAGYGSGDTKR